MNLSDYGVAAGHSANLVILPADNGFDAVRRQVAPRFVIRRGRLIAQTEPAHATLLIGDQPEKVDFKR
jgi:cytosine deaminase